jgi:hypothetical protein
MNKLLMILALGASVALVSCEDPAPPLPPGPNPSPATVPDTVNKSRVITNHTWRLTSFLQGNSELFTSGFRNCQKDDTYDFSTTNTFVIDDSSVKCSPSGSTGSTWSLSADRSYISLNFATKPIIGLQGDLSIKSISESKMILQQNTGGSVYTATFTAQ